MKAVQYTEFGGPEVLKLVDLPDPHPAPGQIRVAVRAVGINPIDWKQRRGGPFGGELPQRTGRDVAGVVDELGEDVSDVALGDRVFGLAVGSTAAAELALLADYAPIPPPFDFTHAAALPIAIETATRCLDLLDVNENTTLLINGAAGAVGSSAVQLARARGAHVIGPASPGNHDYLRSLWTTTGSLGRSSRRRSRLMPRRMSNMATRAVMSCRQSYRRRLVAANGSRACSSKSARRRLSLRGTQW
ncbi:MAG: NADP-dependent oxidoreductase, partial [Solirubrobacterales bacterium]|nr:NADP-dependent oxidoreductase [Solirubrobacterales bacterium]